MSTTSIRRGTVIVAATVLLLAAAPAARASGPDSNRSPQNFSAAAPGRCALERIGTQFVCGDNLTGNGVRAPSWIPDRASAGGVATGNCER